jgi:hypothetical protein
MRIQTHLKAEARVEVKEVHEAKRHDGTRADMKKAREAQQLRGALLGADANARIRPPRLDFGNCALVAGG